MSNIMVRLPLSNVLFSKEIKNAPECIVELYKHAGIFRNTREVSSVLKNPQVLISSTTHEEKVFYFFYEMLKKLCALKLVT